MLMASMFTGTLLLPFLAPLFASSTRSLWRLAFMAFVPAIVLGFIILMPGGGTAFPVFVGVFASAILGTLARRASLIARGYGHTRPWSLWIEILFLILALVFMSAAGL